jgi:hypothetical protein
LIFLEANRHVRVLNNNRATGNSPLATTQKASTTSKTQKLDSKPTQGKSASNQPRISSAVQVISPSINKINVEF